MNRAELQRTLGHPRDEETLATATAFFAACLAAERGQSVTLDGPDLALHGVLAVELARSLRRAGRGVRIHTPSPTLLVRLRGALGDVEIVGTAPRRTDDADVVLIIGIERERLWAQRRTPPDAVTILLCDRRLLGATGALTTYVRAPTRKFDYHRKSHQVFPGTPTQVAFSQDDLLWSAARMARDTQSMVCIVARSVRLAQRYCHLAGLEAITHVVAPSPDPYVEAAGPNREHRVLLLDLHHPRVVPWGAQLIIDARGYPEEHEALMPWLDHPGARPVLLTSLERAPDRPLLQSEAYDRVLRAIEKWSGAADPSSERGSDSKLQSALERERTDLRPQPTVLLSLLRRRAGDTVTMPPGRTSTLPADMAPTENLALLLEAFDTDAAVRRARLDAVMAALADDGEDILALREGAPRLLDLAVNLHEATPARVQMLARVRQIAACLSATGEDGSHALWSWGSTPASGRPRSFEQFASLPAEARSTAAGVLRDLEDWIGPVHVTFDPATEPRATSPSTPPHAIPLSTARDRGAPHPPCILVRDERAADEARWLQPYGVVFLAGASRIEEWLVHGTRLLRPFAEGQGDAQRRYPEPEGALAEVQRIVLEWLPETVLAWRREGTTEWLGGPHPRSAEELDALACSADTGHDAPALVRRIRSGTDTWTVVAAVPAERLAHRVRALLHDVFLGIQVSSSVLSAMRSSLSIADVASQLSHDFNNFFDQADTVRKSLVRGRALPPGFLEQWSVNLVNVRNLSDAVNFVYGQGRRIPKEPSLDDASAGVRVVPLGKTILDAVQIYLRAMEKSESFVDPTGLEQEAWVHTHVPSLTRVVERVLTNAIGARGAGATLVRISSRIEGDVVVVSFWDDGRTKFSAAQVEAIERHQPINVDLSTRQRGNSGRGTLFIQRFCEVHETFQTQRVPRYTVSREDYKTQYLTFPISPRPNPS